MLSRPDIVRYLSDGKLVIEPAINDDQIDQVSIDLHLGRGFTRFKKLADCYSALRVDPSVWAQDDLWETIEADSHVLEPNGLVLAQTLERITMPADLVGLVEGRSSWARIGISIHVTAPKIDPGFSGTITLEMANFGSAPVELRAGKDRPAQLMLLRISTPLEAETLYGTGEKDLFQYQQTPIPQKRNS